MNAPFGREGFTVFESKDGTTALRVIDELDGYVDLLVTDCQMPNMNGIALVRAVQAKYADVPIFMMSG
jgi:two-component system cell cycle sensor histidine kinase/response regulator CckA